MTPVMSKRELKTQIKRFLKDKNRGISTNLFAELCGIHRTMLLDVFYYQTVPLSEYIQKRVSKGFTAWKNGEVAVMQNRDKSRFITYRKEPKPIFTRQTGLQVVDGQIKIRTGVVNRADYSQATLAEQLGRG